MTISKRCDVPSCFLFVVVDGHVCVYVREPVVCFCFEDGITCIRKHCVRYKNLRDALEAVGNFWDILNAILGHTYHSNQSNRFLCNE